MIGQIEKALLHLVKTLASRSPVMDIATNISARTEAEVALANSLTVLGENLSVQAEHSNGGTRIIITIPDPPPGGEFG